MTEPTALRALLTQLSLDVPASDVRVPIHRVAPPATLSRAPNRRSLIGKRSNALLRVTGDCGLRDGELHSLNGPHDPLAPPPANSAHYHVFVRDKGAITRCAGAGRRDQDVILDRLARDGLRAPICQRAVAKLMRRYAAGAPERLAHPHTLHGSYATTLASD